MNQTASGWTPAQAQALAYAWGEYRVWAATARQKKAEIFNWRFRVLALTILGALLGTASSQIAGLQANVSWILGIAGGALIAVATYFGQEVLKPDQELAWVRARSVAEALKTETFLFRTGAPPYNVTDPARVLVSQVRELLDQVKDLPTATLAQAEKLENLPEGFLGVDRYLEERLQDQIEQFYRPRAKEYQAKLKFWQTISFLMGGLAAVLGLLGKWTGAWVAVLTTIGTSVSAYLFANRYQYLIISYQATARQLESLQHGWLAAGAPEQDVEKRYRLIKDCEDAISIENNAWMAKWVEKQPES